MGDPSPPCVCIAASWADEASCVCLRDRDSPGPALSPVQLVRVPRTPADADGWAAGSHRGGRAQAGRGGAPAASSGSLPLAVAAVLAAGGALLGAAVTHLPAVRRVIRTAAGARHSHRGLAPAAEAPSAVEQIEQIRPSTPRAAPAEAAAPPSEEESEQTTPRAAHVGPRLSLTSGSSPLDEATAHRILDDADRVVALKRAAERSAREQAAMGTHSTTRPRRGSSSAAAAVAAGEWASQGGATSARPPHLQSATQPAGGDAWRPWEPDAWDAVDLTGVAFTPLRKPALGAVEAMTPYTQRKGER
jgi:hypothetical protein